MPPPFRFTPFPFRTSPFLFLVLFFFLFALPACPEPPIQSDGSSENTEGGVEKTESTAESTPEESASPEEGATSEEPYTETEPERPETPDTTEPTLTLIEGDDDQPQPISYPSGTTPPADAKPATFRFRTSWRIYGANLLRIERWELHSKDKSLLFTLTASDRKDTDMKLTLPAALTAGFFTLIGFIGNTPAVRSETFVLQGKDGAQGPKGDTGPKGDGFDQTTLDFVNALKSALKPDTAQKSLDITADTVTLKPATAQKVTLDLGNNATIKSGNAALDFTGDTITAKATTLSLDAATKLSLKSPDVIVDSNLFEVKGANATSLKLDDTARSISLRVTQKNATTQATFSLEGGDANTNPAPDTKYPLAIFNRTNIQVQSGAGSTTATINGLGNLIVGYNGKVNQPTAKRTGSHNLIVGDDHDYQNYGGFVSGSQNILIGGFSTVAGGSGSTASGTNSTVAGGSGSTASGTNSTVAGGSGNEAGRDGSSICSSVNVKIRTTDPVNDPIRYCCGRF